MLTAHRPQRAASAILVALLVATACGDPAQRSGEPGTDTARADLRIVAVTHGVSANPFWSVVINGLDDAARDMGVRVEYQAPSKIGKHTSELQSRRNLVCRLLLEKKKI